MYRQFTDLDIRTREPVETNPEVFSLEGLIAWLRTQDPATKYEYLCFDGTCLLGQYLTASGHDPIDDYGRMAACSGEKSLRIVACEIANNRPMTFGAALTRALALQSSTRSGKGMG